MPELQEFDGFRRSAYHIDLDIEDPSYEGDGKISVTGEATSTDDIRGVVAIFKLGYDERDGIDKDSDITHRTEVALHELKDETTGDRFDGEF